MLSDFVTHTRPPKPRHHFVRNEQRAVFARDAGDLPQPTRGLRNHTRRALNQRLENKSGVRVATLPLRGKFLLDLADAFPVAFAVLASVSALGLCAIERTAITVR